MKEVVIVGGVRTPIGSHERIGVIEVFGRNSGETSLIAGYLAGVDDVSDAALRRAMAYGTVAAAYNVEEFSLDRLREIGPDQLDERYRELLAMTRF